MCTVLLPPGDNPIAVNKYIIIIISSKTVRVIATKYILAFMKITRHSCCILKKLDFSGQFFEKKSKISNFTKIRPVGAKLFHAERRTDITKLIVGFRNFVNAPNKMTVDQIYISANIILTTCQMFRLLHKSSLDTLKNIHMHKRRKLEQVFKKTP